MQTVTLGDSGAMLLRETTDVAEVRDTQGNLLGFFTPVGRGCSQPRFTREEVEARCREGGVPLIDVFRRMLNMAPNHEARADLEAHIRELAAETECDTP